MFLVASIILSVLMGYAYLRKGLFLAALLLVSTFLAVLSALAFGSPIAEMTRIYEPTTYSYAMAGTFLLLFGLIRGALAFMDEDVDFHPIIDHLGGAVCGMSAGLITFGFAGVCLLCMPMPQIFASANMKQSIEHTTQLTLMPCNLVWRLVGQEHRFELDNLLAAAGPEYSTYHPPGSEPPRPNDADMANDQTPTEGRNDPVSRQDRHPP